jgi:outer membrane protein
MISAAVTMILASLAVAQPLTLDECVDMALEKNLTFKQMEMSLQTATAEYWSSWSNLLPNVNLSGSYSRWESQEPYPGGFYTYQDTSWSVGVQLSQSIFDTDRFSYVARMKANRDLARVGHKKERLDLVLKVKEDFYNVTKTQNLLEVARTRLRESETSHQKTEQLYELGSASRAALLKAKVNQLESRLELLRAERNAKLAMSNLLLTLGLSPTDEIEIAEEPPIVREDLPSYETLLDAAVLHSPDLGKANASLRIAKADLYASYGSYLPSLSLSASYGCESDRLFPLQESWDGGRKSWRLGLNLSMPIFTGFQRLFAVSGARAQVRHAEYYRETVEKNLALELKNRYLEVMESEEMLELARESLELAKESFEAAKERYNLGAAPILELIDAELSLVRAEGARAEALYDYRLGVERLKTLVGKEDL